MILHHRIPHHLSPRPLPGVQPLDMADWLIVDEVYAPQMAERLRLLETRRAAVVQIDPAALPAAQELLALVLEQLSRRSDFALGDERMLCPDGREAVLDDAQPLETLGQLVQEDFCLLEKRGDEHVLTGAVLCFPASWRLDEKFLRPMTGIHAPVEQYDDTIARRVQRLFDGVKPGRPLWRSNLLHYADPALHQPRSEGARRVPVEPSEARYLRSERQSLVRLPESDAVVFSIHSYVCAA